jgi:nitrogen fixation/metabolism regulation signal transduction histidine kinase
VRSWRGPLAAVAFTGLFAALLWLALTTTEGRASGEGWFGPVALAAALAVAVLAVLILGRLLALWRAARRGVPGARLARRLLGVLLLLVLPPLALSYAFALRAIHGSIDRWFDVSIEAALGDGLVLGRALIEERLLQAEAELEDAAARLQGLPTSVARGVLAEFADRGGASQWLLYQPPAAILALESSDPRLVAPLFPDEAHNLLLSATGRLSLAEPLAGTLALRLARRLGGSGQPVLQLVRLLPESLAAPLAGLERASVGYQRLSFMRDSLKLTFGLVLSLVLLFALLVALFAAIALTGRITSPIGRLAEATERVAEGRFDVSLPVEGQDELAFLARSFNRMAEELGALTARLAASERAAAARRDELDALLASLETGVLGIDGEERLMSANPAAASVLRHSLEPFLGRPLAALAELGSELEPLLRTLLSRFREGALRWQEEVQIARGEERQILMVRGARLRGEREGMVVIVDDRTVLERAQRDAAWAEVARRLAHEIKNPLMPIQLAAERVQLKLAPRLEAADRELLERAARTIVSQVEAMRSMVEGFAEYARAQPPRRQPVSLAALVDEVLALYEHDASLAIERELPASLPPVSADPVRLRQVLHNLIKNAIEAQENSASKSLRLAVARVEREGRPFLRLDVADRGAGLPPGFDASWFEPYRSAKPRGAGLGLAISKRIAEEHGGFLEAAQRPGGGAVFSLFLPL